MWERLRKDLENYCIRQLEGRRTFIPQSLCKYRLLRLTFYPLNKKTHTFIYLPIYVARHYVANFYFPLLLCTHTFIYSDVMSPFFSVSFEGFHSVLSWCGFNWCPHMAKTRNLLTYYCYSQAEPIEQNSSQILLLWCIYKGIKHAPQTTTELQPYSTQTAMYPRSYPVLRPT